MRGITAFGRWGQGSLTLDMYGQMLGSCDGYSDPATVRGVDSIEHDVLEAHRSTTDKLAQEARGV